MALSPKGFLPDGPGLGLKSRPSDRAWEGLGLSFLPWAFLGPAQAWPGPAHGQI